MSRSDVKLILEGSNGRRTKPIVIATVGGGTSKRHITIRADGNIASFKVARWIGAPKPSAVNAAKVHCPMNCQASEFAHTKGASLHPAPSSICTAAILDGLMTPSGGDLVVTARLSQQLRHYHLFPSDSIDLIETAVRVVNGFKTGVLLLDGCKDVEGANCSGSETVLEECAAEKPPDTCMEHTDDVAIKCTNLLAGVEPEAGTIRIVGPTGTPAVSGLGRLQFFNKGREASLNQCPHAVGDDIYCVHAEDVVIACEGDGDPSGVGAFHKEEAVVQKKRFLSLIPLTCFDSLETRHGLGGPPGTMHLVSCPPNCSGTNTQEGGECLLVIGHGQHHFSALEGHGIQSEESGAYPRSSAAAPSPTAPGAGAANNAQRSTATQGGAVASPLNRNAFFNSSGGMTLQATRGKTRWTSTIKRPKAALHSDNAGDDGAGTHLQLSFPSVDEVRSPWTTIDDRRGVARFHGNAADYVDTSILAGGHRVSSIRDFTVAVRAVVTGTGRMIIGRASAAEADYFEGDILGVKVFNQEAPVTTIRDAFAPETLAAHAPQAPSESRRTDDGRLCLSPCSLQGPLWAAAAAAAAAAKPTKPAVSLSCTDSLRRADFNGHIGQKFLAICPPDCLHANAPLEGCNLFTAGSSICKASLHSGAVPKEGGEVLLTVTEGLEFYDASQGHFGLFRATQMQLSV
ncbi:scavenger receptor protein SR2, putative [Eimeria maxima]|uniref:Scavenger receptor protein SR2, putative n=1 Tax=Eimeria maxima TaxID=5804 RepID=U6MGF7_EIMMA|nr:scavenger receptor protein SR2, putative [Eimeria maxima]CDJ60735.1 scavenger receptor protein SR2, putative [Eimeria maxima]